MVDGPSPFEFEMDGNCGKDWKIWLRGFEIFAQASKIDDDSEKLNWMLHYADPKVQTVYHSLSDESNEVEIKQESALTGKGPWLSGFGVKQTNEYTDAITRLNGFFEPKQNESYERHVFRGLRQNENERIDMFLMRLREQADRCNFAENLDDNIRDQITSGCSSDILRRKILERSDENLDKIIKMARLLEAVAKQQQSFNQSHSEPSAELISGQTKTKESAESVCKIDVKRKFALGQNKGDMHFIGNCGRCGFKGHRSADQKCPARGKICNRCGRKDHFSRKCFASEAQVMAYKAKGKFENRDENEPPAKIKRDGTVNLVEVKPPTDITEEYEDLFCIDSDNATGNKVTCIIGGIDTLVVVDSGSRYNIVDRISWIDLKAKNIATIFRQKEVDINFQAYGGYKLKFLGKFRAIVKTPYKQTEADFYVADEFGKVLLGYETSIALGILKIGLDAEPVNAIEKMEPFGKIKDVMVNISIKPDAKGVVQAYRRVPAPLEKLVDNKIDELLREGIIEKVDGVSNWVSPTVVTPKGNDDVRICVDMRRANMAIERENHPLPVMDNFLPHLGEAKIFSKLDIKQAFHQVDYN